MDTVLKFMIFALITVLGAIVPAINIDTNVGRIEHLSVSFEDCTNSSDGVCARQGFTTTTNFGWPLSAFTQHETVGDGMTPVRTSVTHERSLNTIFIIVNLLLYLYVYHWIKEYMMKRDDPDPAEETETQKKKNPKKTTEK